jgi:malate dehydrogenase (oxaloacetate-decarboxylating)(NADP+)
MVQGEKKYLVLSDLQARNETLFYVVLMSDPAKCLPIVYTPGRGLPEVRAHFP